MTTNILVIDDDPAVTELLTLLLRSLNYEVFSANSGARGLELVREKNPDLVILDLMMPEMDGWQVCKTMRTFTNTPIIVLSALNDPAIIASILDAGADDYITKPTPSSVLAAHINKLVRRTTGGLKTTADKSIGAFASHP